MGTDLGGAREGKMTKMNSMAVSEGVYTYVYEYIGIHVLKPCAVHDSLISPLAGPQNIGDLKIHAIHQNYDFSVNITSSITQKYQFRSWEFSSLGNLPFKSSGHTTGKS